MCSLIILPLTEKSYDEIEISYVTFIEEFKKIENEISSSQYNIYILKCIIDSAQKYMDEYYTSESTSKVVSKFRADVNSAIFSVSKFCSPRNIHYEKMLCALYNFSNCAEGMMYKFMKKSLKQKDSEYKNIKISDINEIVNILDVNLEEKYVYNQKTNIVVIDNINESRESFSLDKKMIEKLNKQNSNYKKAIFLYESFVPEETVSETSRSRSHSHSRSETSRSETSRSEKSRSRSKREKRSRSETSEDNENELSDEDILAYLN
jgi:hypoxanthine phosphoribosyltransferase